MRVVLPLCKCGLSHMVVRGMLHFLWVWNSVVLTAVWLLHSCLQTCITLTLKSTHTNTPKHTQRWGHWNLTNKNILSPQKYSSKWEDRKFQTKLWDTLDLFGNAMYIRMIFTSKILALNFSCPMHLSSRSQFSKHFMGKEWDCRSGWLGGYT